jgi:cell division protein FtsB
MRYWDPGRKPSPRKRTTRKSRPPGGRSVTKGGSLREYPFLRKFYQHQAVIGVGLQKFLFFLLIATVLYAFVFGDGGAIRILTLKNDKAQLEHELALLTGDTEAMRAEMELLKDDPTIMEKLGRERYGYIYPGERVFKIIPTPKKR